MKNKLALVIAIVLGLIAVFGVRQFIKRKDEQYKDRFKPVRVATAKERIKAGTPIEMKMLEDKGRVVSEDSLTADHVLNREKFILSGKLINRDLERGEPLLKSYFRKPVVRLENKLEHGQRAVTLKVDAVTGVAGNVVPGSHVDILGTFPIAPTAAPGAARARSKESVTALMLSNVKILAVDSRTREAQYSLARRAGRGYSSVTVAVTPEEANVLVFAQSFGGLTLTLRAPADSEMREPPPEISENNLLKKATELERARRERLKPEPPIKFKMNK